MVVRRAEAEQNSLEKSKSWYPAPCRLIVTGVIGLFNCRSDLIYSIPKILFGKNAGRELEVMQEVSASSLAFGKERPSFKFSFNTFKKTKIYAKNIKKI